MSESELGVQLSPQLERAGSISTGIWDFAPDQVRRLPPLPDCARAERALISSPTRTIKGIAQLGKATWNCIAELPHETSTGLEACSLWNGMKCVPEDEKRK